MFFYWTVICSTNRNPPLKIDERKNFEKLFFFNRILKGDFKLGRCYQNDVNIFKVEWDTCQY